MRDLTLGIVFVACVCLTHYLVMKHISEQMVHMSRTFALTQNMAEGFDSKKPASSLRETIQDENVLVVKADTDLLFVDSRKNVFVDKGQHMTDEEERMIKVLRAEKSQYAYLIIDDTMQLVSSARTEKDGFIIIVYTF